MNQAMLAAVEDVQHLLHTYYPPDAGPTGRPTGEQHMRLSKEIVNRVGERMRNNVEEEMRDSHRLRNNAEIAEEQKLAVHRGIADYCRERRLDMEGAAVPLGQQDLMAMLALDEVHYRRLAEAGTRHRAEAPFQNFQHFVGAPPKPFPKE